MIAELLAKVVDTDPDRYDVLAARQYLGALLKIVQDELIVDGIAQRLCEHHYGLWDNQPPEVHNDCTLQTMNVLDALRDIIAEDLAR